MLANGHRVAVGRPTVVHAIGWYFPDKTGGTEVYVDALAQHLVEYGISSVIGAAIDGDPADYVWNGVPVHRYAVPTATHDEIAEALPPRRLDEFEAWLQKQNAQIFHQHSWSRGCGIAHLRLAKRLGLKTVLTAHVPSVLCLRGTMMLNGSQPCDGHVELSRCSSCWATARGIPAGVAAWQSRHVELSQRLAKLVPESRLKTALATPAFVGRQLAALQEIALIADKIVAVCRWLRDALLLNGLPAEKVVYCAQGVDSEIVEHERGPHALGPLRVAFLGRWDPVKGLHVLIEAFRRLEPTVQAELFIHALPQDSEYERQIRQAGGNDSRIHFEQPISRDHVIRTLATYDVVAIPSLWLETGPLVALEALAAGVPIVGSRLGGISELVQTDADGCLVAPGDVNAWSKTIATRAREHAAGVRQERPSPPRKARDVAAEMSTIYGELLHAS